MVVDVRYLQTNQCPFHPNEDILEDLLVSLHFYLIIFFLGLEFIILILKDVVPIGLVIHWIRKQDQGEKSLPQLDLLKGTPQTLSVEQRQLK